MLEHIPNHSQIDLATIEPLLTGLANRVIERLTTTAPIESMTFGELFSLYCERHVESNCTAAGKRNFQYFYTKHTPRWDDVPVHSIRKRDVQAWVDALTSDSPSSAARAVNVMQAIINWGVKRELIPPITNPCKGIERPRLRSRERFAKPSELAKLELALQEESPLIRDFFWICVHTGARKSNVLAMRWDEIDFETQTWTIPHSKFKNGDTHVVPLFDAALTILKRRHQSATSPWVFPGRHGTHLKWVRRAWMRVLERAEIIDLNIHDLRRTFGSYMAMNGANQYTIGKMLGHKDMRSTMVYARLDLSAVRREAGAVSEKIQNLVATPLQVKQTAVSQIAPSAPNKQNTESEKRLTPAKQAVVEGKIMSVMLAGGNSKKHFYSKLGSQFAIDSFELNRVINEMTQRGLIRCTQNDFGKLRYSLLDEVTR